MVEIFRARHDARRACGQHAFTRKRHVVAVNHPGRVDFTGHQSQRRVALAADVVAVLAAQHIEAFGGVVLPGQQAVLAQVVERNQARLRRVDGTESDGFAGQIGQRAALAHG